MERKYNKEILEKAAKESLSISQVCRKVGCPDKGGSYELIKYRLIEYNIDTKHFLGQSYFAGKRNPRFEKRLNKESILTDNKIKRVSHNQLKRALIESGINYTCNNCGIKDWMGKKIVLDVDHINGDWSNCKIENLRFLCPNCHRQTETFGGIKKEKEKFYCECGNKKNKVSKYCRLCFDNKRLFASNRNKLNLEELKLDVWKEPFNKLCKKYELSDRYLLTICEINNIPYPKKGYWISKRILNNIDKDTFIEDLKNSTYKKMYEKYKMNKNSFKAYCKDNNIKIEDFYISRKFNQYTNVLKI